MTLVADAMAAFLGRVHRMTEEVCRKRGRPLLIAVRVPDSPGSSQPVGLDVERWLREGLVDLPVAGGDFQLDSYRTRAVNAWNARAIVLTLNGRTLAEGAPADGWVEDALAP